MKRKFKHNSKCPEENCDGVLKQQYVDPYSNTPYGRV